MAYYMFFGKTQLPVTPEKIEMSIKNKNETMSLINFGEVNVARQAGLTDISFELLLPNQKYPFATYKGGTFHPAEYYLDKLEKLKTKKKSFQWIVTRMTPNNKKLYYTNMKVLLEDYSIVESTDNGMDVVVKVNLKQFKSWSMKKYKVKKKKGQTVLVEVKASDKSNSTSNKTYTVKKNDTLYNIAKKYYGDGTQWKKIYNANKSVIEKAAKENGRKSSSNGQYIYAKTKLVIPVNEG